MYCVFYSMSSDIGGQDHKCTAKAVADGPVGQVLAGPIFLKVKTKFHFTKSK